MPEDENETFRVTNRSKLAISINVDPYKQAPIIFDVNLEGHKKAYARTHWSLENRDLVSFCRFLVEGGSPPGYFDQKGNLALNLVGAFFPPLLLLALLQREKNNWIPEATPKSLTWGSTLGSFGGVAFGLGILGVMISENNYEYPSFGYLAALGAVFLVLGRIIMVRRKEVVATPKQPDRLPRMEFLVDSWSVSVPEGGANFDHFRNRIYSRLERLDSNIRVDREIFQTRTPTGYEERERLVLSKGQGTFHAHIYPFSHDAFVGWESYLNWAKWAETDSGGSIVKQGGARLLLRSLQVGVHIPSTVDMMELNSLTEMAHRVIVDEVKSFLRSRDLEADLDFKIVRGDRANALSKQGKQDLDGNPIR